MARFPYMRGVSLRPCKGPQRSTLEQPCDPGATAWDAQDGNLTARVQVSPSSVRLDAPPGTHMKLTYTVADHGSPRMRATSERVVEIVSPCAAGQFFCDGRCEQVSCKELAALAAAALVDEDAADSRPPAIVLVQPERTDISTVYDEAAQLPLLMLCTAADLDAAGLAVSSNITEQLHMADSTPACGAVAVSAAGELLDTGEVTVVEAFCSAADACPLCPVAGFASGLCLPGVHVAQFTAKSEAGIAAPLQRRAVFVAEAADLPVSVQMPYAGSLAQADQFAATIAGTASVVDSIVSGATQQVQETLLTQDALAAGVSDVAGRLVNVTAKIVPGGDTPVVAINVAVAFKFVPGVPQFTQAWPDGVHNGTALALANGVASRRLLIVDPEVKWATGLNDASVRSRGMQRRLKQDTRVAGMAEVLAGTLCGRACCVPAVLRGPACQQLFVLRWL